LVVDFPPIFLIHLSWRISVLPARFYIELSFFQLLFCKIFYTSVLCSGVLFLTVLCPSIFFSSVYAFVFLVLAIPKLDKADRHFVHSSECRLLSRYLKRILLEMNDRLHHQI